MKTAIVLFLLQSVYSFLSTCRINDAVGNNTLKYVLSAGMSDIVKYTISANIAVQVVLFSQWLTIFTTVLGGILGNFLGHKLKLHRETSGRRLVFLWRKAPVYDGLYFPHAEFVGNLRFKFVYEELDGTLFLKNRHIDVFN